MLNIILAILAIYNGISYFFLMNPTLLHKYKTKIELPDYPTGYKKYVHSHRGGGAFEAPENTLQAF